MSETGNAHDSGDCLANCEHPDHLYEGEQMDNAFYELEQLLRIRELAKRNSWQLTEVLDALSRADSLEGPLFL